MRFYLKNNPEKFRPDPILSDGTLGDFSEDRRPTSIIDCITVTGLDVSVTPHLSLL